MGNPGKAAVAREDLRILGIDPGSLVTGYGVVDYRASRIHLVEQGAIRGKKGDDLGARLERIYYGITELIERVKPSCVAVETPYSGVNARSLIQLAQARGVILLAARIAGLDISEYSPRSIKGAVVGYGGAEKKQVAHMVRILVRGTEDARLSADAADALAVAICHAHSGQSRMRLARVRG